MDSSWSIKKSQRNGLERCLEPTKERSLLQKLYKEQIQRQAQLVEKKMMIKKQMFKKTTS